MDPAFFADSGKADFCLKVADSRRQDWRLEQRFDKLFEALEILCRYIAHSEPSMASKVADALQHIEASERDQLNAILADNQRDRPNQVLRQTGHANEVFRASAPCPRDPAAVKDAGPFSVSEIIHLS
jgi:dsDNA-binding SOS-regulon protein